MESQFYVHIVESISEALFQTIIFLSWLMAIRATTFMFGYDKREVQNASLDLIIPPT